MTPEVKALALAAIRAARWVDDGPLVSGCVKDSGEAVREAVADAVKAVQSADDYELFHRDVVTITSRMAEQGATAKDVAYAVEKPWKHLDYLNSENAEDDA